MTEGNILIIAEQLGDNLLPVTYEIVSLARRLRGNKNADVEIAVAVAAANDAAPGEYRARGELKFQACNSRMCLFPSSVPVELLLVVAAP